MRKILTVNNFLFSLVCIYAVYTLFPVVRNNFAKEGQSISISESQTITANGVSQKILFPSQDRTIAIFWASWCGPCKLEMSRLSASVNEGKIPVGAIVAINPFESSDKVRIYLKDHSFPFTFIEDRGISRFLNVKTTPTTLYIKNNIIIGLSSGLSLLGIWRAEQFL